MGIFEFVIALVLIATIGEVVKARVGRPAQIPTAPADSQHLEDSVEHLNQRVLRLEEERDFYRALLEPGEDPRGPASVEQSPRPPEHAPGAD